MQFKTWGVKLIDVVVADQSAADSAAKNLDAKLNEIVNAGYEVMSIVPIAGNALTGLTSITRFVLVTAVKK